MWPRRGPLSAFWAPRGSGSSPAFLALGGVLTLQALCSQTGLWGSAQAHSWSPLVPQAAPERGPQVAGGHALSPPPLLPQACGPAWPGWGGVQQERGEEEGAEWSLGSRAEGWPGDPEDCLWGVISGSGSELMLPLLSL